MKRIDQKNIFEREIKYELQEQEKHENCIFCDYVFKVQ